MNVVEWVRRDFDRKRQQDPHLSLRSYARSIDYDASTLAKYLSGERTPGLKSQHRLMRSILPTQSRDTHISLDEDHFQSIAEWYHFAILEMTRLHNFRDDPMWIARRLRISVHDVRSAIQRLEKIGALRRENGEWKIQSLTTTQIPGTTTALKLMQRQILEKAISALHDSTDLRSQSSMTMAIDRSRISEAKALITDFRRKMSELLESSDHLDEVYLLSVSLFPVT